MNICNKIFLVLTRLNLTLILQIFCVHVCLYFSICIIVSIHFFVCKHIHQCIYICVCMYVCMYACYIVYTHHHHDDMPPAWMSLTLPRHSSLSFIASGRSSGLHPISSQSCCMYVQAGRPTFVRPYEEVHRSTSLMSSSLLLQQCPACLVHLTWIFFMMGGKWLYSWCFVGCCLHDLFNIAHSVFV